MHSLQGFYFTLSLAFAIPNALSFHTSPMIYVYVQFVFKDLWEYGLICAGLQIVRGSLQLRLLIFWGWERGVYHGYWVEV